MQTGNTIIVFSSLVGLSEAQPGLIGAPTRLALIRSAVSLCAFVGGAMFFGLLHHYCQNHRWAHMLDFLLQTVCCTVAATLGTLHIGVPVADDPILMMFRFGTSPGLELVHVSLLAFQAAATVVLSRVHMRTDLPTNVISSHYVDILRGLPEIGTPKYKETDENWWLRNRRWTCKLVAVLLLMLGCALGGAMPYHAAIWIVVGIKASMVFIFGWWKWTGVREC